MLINLPPGGEPPDVPGFTCDRCGGPATVHLCSINHGVKTESHLCDQHANQEMGGAPFDTPAMHRQVAVKMRAMAAFMRSRGRMPGLDETAAIHGIGAAPPDAEDSAPVAEITNPQLLEQIVYMERVADFMETHGRMPNAGELPPDPF
jgi:hypothetical protein